MEETVKSLESTALFETNFAFLSCHSSEKELPEVLMQQVGHTYKLNYYSPHSDQGLQSEQQQETKTSPYTHSYQVAADPRARVVVGCLSNAYMTSYLCLMEVLHSQVGQDPPLPFVPLVLEPVALMNNQEYDRFLQTLTAPMSMTKEEEALLVEKMELMEKKIKRDSNYANYNQDTMTAWGNYLKGYHQNNASLTQRLCYAIFKEIINSLHCNFIFIPHYSKETLPQLYQAMAIRLRNSTPGGNSPFSDAKYISAKEEAFFFKHVQDTISSLENFHRTTPEECVIEGGTLVELKTTHPNVMLCFSVRQIASNAMKYNHFLEEIILPDGVEIIDSSAFEECTSLQNVFLPPQVVSLENRAFYNCRNLRNIHLSHVLRDIGAQVFSDCHSLKYLKLPKTLRSLGESALENCVALEEINLPDTLEVIPADCFRQCTSLKALVFPSHLKEIQPRRILTHRATHHRPTRGRDVSRRTMFL